MVRIRRELCPQNHPCPVVRVCPVGAISQAGYSAPEIDQKKCTHCGICVQSCSVFSAQ